MQTAFHPGEHIQEELDALGMSCSTVAECLGIPARRLQAVIAGEQNVDAELAMRLGHYFGTSAQFWLNLQVMFDLEVATMKHGEEINALPTLSAA